jgi:FkbM family methyltransferase
MIVLHGAVRTCARSLLRLLSEREYRRVSALSLRYFAYPRRRAGSVSIDGRSFAFPDTASFLSAYEEIFADDIYRFEPTSDSPLIVDVGANVGVSVLYFKKMYPKARVIAFEPDPSIFSYLEKNVATFGLTNVELRNEAVWSEESTLTFAPDGADGGRVTTQGNGQPAGALVVRARSIRSVLDHPHIDFLKMDIEGAENVVLPAGADMLKRVDNVFVEYHSPAKEPQQLHRIMDALASAGFRVSIVGNAAGRAPLLQRNDGRTFDLQLNIFGRR